MIRFSCACGKDRQVPDMFAGRSVKCPDCGAVTVVPAAVAAPASEGLPSPVDGPPAAPPRPVELITQERFVAAKGDSGRLRLHLPFTSLSGAALIVAFFCMPWLRTSCGNLVMAEPTGYNLATNTVDAGMQELREKSEKSMATMSKAYGMDMSTFMKLGNPEEVKDPPWGSKSPELWTFPALGALLLAWGLFRILVPSYSIGRETVALLVLVLGCGAFLTYERCAWYRKKPLQNMKSDLEKAMRKQAETGPQLPNMDVDAMQKDLLDYFLLKDQQGFWLTVIALCSAALSMTVWLVFPGSRAG
ncbi:MAG: hypothetical protein FD180_1415 [Planctomycetota bacterium]|nr:MAG: hypothetical protein FD180_1415 [Planctomycetota bacterium]